MPDEPAGAGVAPATTDAGAAPVAAATPVFIDMVPESYREKTYIQDIARSEKPFENLLNQFENQQTLIGKKSNGVEIPGESATAEAIKAFHKALGVPDTTDGYAYKAPDVSQESDKVQKYLSANANENFMSAIKAKALEAGLTPKQFESLAGAFDAFNVEQARLEIAAGEKRNQEQIAKFRELYGDKSQHVEQLAKDIIAKVVPQNIRDIGDPMIALAEMARYVHEKVFKNDTIDRGGEGAPPASAEDYQKKINELRAKPEFRDDFHRDSTAIRAQVRKLTEDMIALKKPTG